MNTPFLQTYSVDILNIDIVQDTWKYRYIIWPEVYVNIHVDMMAGVKYAFLLDICHDVFNKIIMVFKMHYILESIPAMQTCIHNHAYIELLLFSKTMLNTHYLFLGHPV